MHLFRHKPLITSICTFLVLGVGIKDAYSVDTSDNYTFSEEAFAGRFLLANQTNTPLVNIANPENRTSALFRGYTYSQPITGGIYKYKNGKAIKKVYAGKQRVLSMITCRNAIFTAFSGKGIYRSPDGNNLGGGGKTKRVYKGKQSVRAMKCANGNVITTFSRGGTYLSPDGNNLGGGGKTRRI